MPDKPSDEACKFCNDSGSIYHGPEPEDGGPCPACADVKSPSDEALRGAADLVLGCVAWDDYFAQDEREVEASREEACRIIDAFARGYAAAELERAVRDGLAQGWNDEEFVERLRARAAALRGGKDG